MCSENLKESEMLRPGYS